MGQGISVTIARADRNLVEQLTQEINRFNIDETGFDDGMELTVRAIDEQGRLAGGLSGWTWGGCGYVEYLWVRPDCRRARLGTAVMDAAEQEAAARGCLRMALSTHSFQAPDFYRERGYAETGRTPGYPAGHSQVHMVKELVPR